MESNHLNISAYQNEPAIQVFIAMVTGDSDAAPNSGTQAKDQKPPAGQALSDINESAIDELENKSEPKDKF